jgi:predicted O-methyltransferase YrrM
MTFPDHLEAAVKAVFADDNLVNIQQHEWEMREFMRQCLIDLKPERTVELGTYKGWTAALLSLITTRYTVSVDIEDHGTMGMFAWWKAGSLETILADATTPDCVTKVIARLGGPIDLLFIDDGHYYEQIVREFELWRPHVRPGGWIVFHDINPLANIGPHGTQPECIQVPRFWKELEGNKEIIIATDEHKAWKGTLPHGGLGILRV